MTGSFEQSVRIIKEVQKAAVSKASIQMCELIIERLEQESEAELREMEKCLMPLTQVSFSDGDLPY